MSESGASLFREPGAPLTARVADLVGRLTLEEKLGLLHQRQAAIPRLGLEPFTTGTEALHGIAWLGPATVFPQAVGLASTWNLALVGEVGAAVGDEARGLHHKDPARAGLNVWAPVVNPLRDPRWGRNEEGYAEDPALTAVMGTAYANGLRGDHPTYLRTAPTLKHFLAYNNETDRSQTSSNMPARVLHEYELPAFRGPIVSGAAVGVMPSYNLVNGRPAHLSPLINDVLRRWTSDEILVVSDAGAPANLVTPQEYYPDHATGCAALLKAGLDSFTDGEADTSVTLGQVAEALQRGLLEESDIDAAVRRILTIRFRLGEFDPPHGNPYASITEEVINCPGHQALAREAAQQAIVLLKNDDATLPLREDSMSRIAVLGPSGDSLYEDWYSGTLPYAVTVRRGITERLTGSGFASGSVTFAEGVDRITLRLGRSAASDPATEGRLAARNYPDGAALYVDAGAATDPATQFDLFDWGNGVLALRSVANGRYLTVDDAGVLVNAANQPNGWFVRETFAVKSRGAELVIRHLASDRYLTVDASGAVRADAPDAEQAQGFLLETVRSGIDDAVAAARHADVAVVVLGNHPLINGRETEDRVDLRLPPAQDELLRAVCAVNPRTVLVVTSSYPYGITWAQEHVPAIVWSAHGGQEFGHALAAVLFGDTAPAGRLTQTWYHSAADLPDLLDYDIIATDATYLYFRGTPLYPFGHGLTYPSFEYSGLKLSTDRVGSDGSVEIVVEVSNTGDRDSDEVVQLYTHQRTSRVKQPLRALRAFTRVRVPAGAHTTVRFELNAEQLAFWDVTRERLVVEAADHDILVGRSSADIRVTGRLHVDGEVIPPRDPRRPLTAMNADEYADADLVDADKRAGEAVLARADGAWVLFSGTDLEGVASCTATVSHLQRREITVHLRRDDPLDGPLLATLTAQGTGDRYAWTTASAEVAPTTGVHDVYAVLGSRNGCLRDLRFSQGTPGI
ncbi:MAG TPA: glycoside hydrolase family 3 C-terminal domain-containing protein [Micromonosporaceae bacterium]|nr:glycoside hydrolase family 3 C-terminal domain-containing protein [Micromonosporaceae bacterium]